jgi:multidrug resistance efflux pump
MAGSKNSLSSQLSSLSSCATKNRKKRSTRIIVTTFLLIVLLTGVFLRFAYTRYLEKKRMVIMQDYDNHLDQLNESLARLEESGRSLDVELNEMRSKVERARKVNATRPS